MHAACLNSLSGLQPEAQQFGHPLQPAASKKRTPTKASWTIYWMSAVSEVMGVGSLNKKKEKNLRVRSKSKSRSKSGGNSKRLRFVEISTIFATISAGETVTTTSFST